MPCRKGRPRGRVSRAVPALLLYYMSAQTVEFTCDLAERASRPQTRWSIRASSIGSGWRRRGPRDVRAARRGRSGDRGATLRRHPIVVSLQRHARVASVLPRLGPVRRCLHAPARRDVPRRSTVRTVPHDPSRSRLGRQPEEARVSGPLASVDRSRDGPAESSLIAQRTGWPADADEVCEEIERAYPYGQPQCLPENMIRGFERPAGFTPDSFRRAWTGCQTHQTHPAGVHGRSPRSQSARGPRRTVRRSVCLLHRHTDQQDPRDQARADQPGTTYQSCHRCGGSRLHGSDDLAAREVVGGLFHPRADLGSGMSAQAFAVDVVDRHDHENAAVGDHH